MAATPVRSTFVTVLAWIVIGLAGFASLIGILQNILLQTVFLPDMEQGQMQAQLATMPAPFAWFAAHFIWFFRAMLLLSGLSLVAAIGLLRRHNWARLLFIGLLVFGMLYQVLGLGFQWWFMHGMSSLMLTDPQAPAEAAQGMAAVMTAMQVFAALVALAMCGLFGWLIYRLRRPAVLLEFGRAAVVPEAA